MLPSHGKDTLAGVEGAQRLLKAYVSVKWMVSVMAAWGEDMVCDH